MNIALRWWKAFKFLANLSSRDLLYTLQVIEREVECIKEDNIKPSTDTEYIDWLRHKKYCELNFKFRNDLRISLDDTYPPIPEGWVKELNKAREAE